MKIILIEDVKGTGKRGDVIEAKDGFCHNFLFPQKLALPANKQNMNMLEKEKERILKQKDELLQAAKSLSEKLSGKEFKIHVKAGENGKLFGSVTNKEIADAIEKIEGIHVDKKKVVAGEHLKTIGTHDAHIKLHPEVETVIKVVLAPIGEE